MQTNLRNRFAFLNATQCLYALTTMAWGLSCFGGNAAYGFSAGNPWSVTASGDPAKVTWGFARDGSLIPGGATSDVIGFLDTIFNVTTVGGNLTQRPWFGIFEESFDRWSRLSGINFVYEAADDGAILQNSPGSWGVRADIRIGSKYIDGPSGALAAAWMPNTGDIILDSGDILHFANSSYNYRRPKNTIMHETGHALGLMHFMSSDSALLMEPMTAVSFDGPQLDDIRGMHSLYGDVYEKSNNGLGNGTASRATNLGTLALGKSLSIGSDAAGNQVVLSEETDFVSITDSTDVDFYSFTVAVPGYLNVSLLPWGGTFNQTDGNPLNTSALNDLSFSVIGTNGSSVLRHANQSGPGTAEVIAGMRIPTAGRYYVRVLGSLDAIQLYELDLSFTSAPANLPGDFNGDGAVDGKDFIVWQRSYGHEGSFLPADGNGDGQIDAADLAIWQAHFGTRSSLNSTLASVPEPGSLVLASALIIAATLARRSAV